MNAEELLQDVELPEQKDDHEDIKRERLSAIVAGGGSKQYLGKDLQMSDIDKMTPEQINKLYCRYEARLGASMTKTIVEPSPPVGPVEFSDIQKTSVVITWKPSENDGGSPITGYYIEMREAPKSSWQRVTTVDADITTFRVQNVKDKKEYFFKIYAENEVGRSDALVSQFAVPSKPGNLKIKDYSLTLTWKPPKEDGGSKVEKYHIMMKEKDGDWKDIATAKANDKEYKVPDLKRDKKYDFAVAAENKVGRGDAMETTAPTVLEEKPKKPVKPFPPSPLVNNFKSSWKPVATVGPEDTSYKVPDLKEYEEYASENVAENKDGRSDALVSDSVKVQSKFDKPSAPVGPLNVSDFTGDSVTLSWQPPESNGGTPVTHYLIEKFYKVAEIKVKNQTWVIPKLYEDQPYLFRVSAINAEGQGPYLQTGTETKPHKPADKPSAPVGPLNVSDITEDSVTLSWQPPESDGGTPVTKYFIEKCDAKRKSWNKVAKIKAKNLTYCIPKLYEDKPYLFRVSAINAKGQGPYLKTDTETKPHKPAEVEEKEIAMPQNVNGAQGQSFKAEETIDASTNLNFAPSSIKEGISRLKFYELIDSKLNKMMEKGYNVNPKNIKKGIDNTMKATIIRVTDEGDLDQRYKSNNLYVLLGYLPDVRSSPQHLQRDEPSRQGVVKPNKRIHWAYHKAQKELFNHHNIKCNEKGFIVLHEDRQKTNTFEFCNTIDNISMSYLSQLCSNANKSKNTTPELQEQLLKKITPIVIKILCGRIYTEMATPNDLLKSDEWDLWTKHMQAIASFGTLLTILEIRGIQLWGGLIEFLYPYLGTVKAKA